MLHCWSAAADTIGAADSRAAERCSSAVQRAAASTHPVLLAGEVEAVPGDALLVLARRMLRRRGVQLVFLLVREHLRRSSGSQGAATCGGARRGFMKLRAQSQRSVEHRVECLKARIVPQHRREHVAQCLGTVHEICADCATALSCCSLPMLRSRFTRPTVLSASEEIVQAVADLADLSCSSPRPCQHLSRPHATAEAAQQALGGAWPEPRPCWRMLTTLLSVA